MEKITEEDVKGVIKGYQREAEKQDDLASYNDIKNELDTSRGNVFNKCKSLEDSDQIERALGNGGNTIRWKIKGSNPVGIRSKVRIRGARNNLRQRILREPTIQEVAEEIGLEASEPFRARFRNAVGEDWRSPKKSSIKEKRSEVQEKVEDALKIHLGWESEEENDSSEYYEENKNIFYGFEFHVEEWLTHDAPRKFKVKVPPKLGKFMEKNEFYIRVPLDGEDTDSMYDKCMSKTKQARKQCVESKDSWGDI